MEAVFATTMSNTSRIMIKSGIYVPCMDLHLLNQLCCFVAFVIRGRFYFTLFLVVSLQCVHISVVFNEDLYPHIPKTTVVVLQYMVVGLPFLT